MTTYSALHEHIILESFLDEMANLNPDDTGLPYVVWLGEVGGQHGPRIKVSNTKGKMNKNSCFVMTVSRNPEVITPRSCMLKNYEVDDIKDWIQLNYDTLMSLWKAYETGVGSVHKLLLDLRKL